MNKILFSPEAIEVLKKNPNIRNITEKSITYTDEFKEHFLEEYQKGVPAIIIFEECGFDIEMIGEKRIDNCTHRWQVANRRFEGVKDLRKQKCGRPISRTLSMEEENRRLKAENEYLKAEREFLLELERLEREVIKRTKLKSKTNTKSSKG